MLSSKSKFEQLSLLIWHFVVHLTMSSSQLQVAMDQNSAEDVLVLVDDCTPYKCCMVSLALETIADLLE
jgi:orotidine-5'-phosphate decarboxylase